MASVESTDTLYQSGTCAWSSEFVEKDDLFSEAREGRTAIQVCIQSAGDPSIMFGLFTDDPVFW